MHASIQCCSVQQQPDVFLLCFSVKVLKTYFSQLLTMNEGVLHENTTFYKSSNSFYYFMLELSVFMFCQNFEVS